MAAPSPTKQGALSGSWVTHPPAKPPVSPPKSICVIGAGHVGAPHAIVAAKKCPGVKIVVVDDDAAKIKAWNSSMLPFYEPGMQEMLEDVRGGNLSFSTDVDAAIAECEIILVSVSTPLKTSGVGANMAPDLVHWEAMARRIATIAKTSKIIVERSTVPVKTASAMAAVLASNNPNVSVVVLSNPEFAREGTALTDLASPERVMIGGPDSEEGALALEKLAALYASWVPREKIIASNVWSAELAKLTANAFLAQRIVSINSISALCERTKADVTEVAFAIGVDSRIGRKNLVAGIGFGGLCYETHLRNLVYLCRSYRLTQVADYWESVIKMNDWQKSRFAKKVVSSMFNTISGKKLAVLGFSYKKNTSDTRNSPAIDICKVLIKERANVSVYDPRVSAHAIGIAFTDEEGASQCVSVAEDAYKACADAHAILILTEWDEFTRLDFARIYASMQKPAFIFDGRNLLDMEALEKLGFTVHGIGKHTDTPEDAAKADEAKRAAIAHAARIKAGAVAP